MELKSSLPTYLSKCADTDENFCPTNGGSKTLWNFDTGQKLRTKPFYCNHLQMPLNTCFPYESYIL